MILHLRNLSGRITKKYHATGKVITMSNKKPLATASWWSGVALCMRNNPIARIQSAVNKANQMFLWIAAGDSVMRRLFRYLQISVIKLVIVQAEVCQQVKFIG
jgi:hypothetical protein